MITAKAAATIWRGVEAAFTQLRPRGCDAGLLTALAAEEVPAEVTYSFRSNYWDAHNAFFKFPSGRWFEEHGRVGDGVLADLKTPSPTEGGEELLRRFANAARSEFFRLAGPIPWAPGRTMRSLPFESMDVDRTMAASGYKWQGTEYVKESATTVAQVPPVAGVVALVQQAGLDQAAEELIIPMLELADEGLTSNDLQGWTTATNKARDALAQIIANTSAKVGKQTTKQAEARQQLTKAGITTPEQEKRMQMIYGAVCETAHKITTRHDAVLDVAVCLVLAEFVLRKFLERPRT